MTHKFFLLTTAFILLCRINVVFSQEWQYQLEWGDLSNVEYSIGDV